MSSTRPYSYTLQWSISQIHFNPFKSGRFIASPTFQVTALGGTRWELLLYPRGTTDLDYMALYLHRRKEGGASGPTSVSVDFQMSVDNLLDDRSFSKSVKGVPFKRNEVRGFNRLMRCSLARLMSNLSVKKTFTVRCEMSLSDTADIAEDSTFDLRGLSEDMGRIRSMHLLSDVVLKCDGEEIPAHKIVLTARAPKLARALKLAIRDVVDVPFMSGRVLRTLLHYAYTGDVDSFSTPMELLRIAEQFNLWGLLKLIQVVPNSCHAETHLNVEHKSILWSLGKEKGPFVRTVATPGLHLSGLVLSVDITDEIRVGVKPMGMTLDKGVFVKCTVVGIAHYNLFWDLCSGEHLFENEEEEWAVDIAFLDRCLPQFSVLGIEIDVCDGICSSRFHQESSTSFVCAGHRDMGKFSRDFRHFADNPSFSDAVVACGPCTFHAHRAVLAARSPVFRKMFEHDFLEKRTGRVKVMDFRPNIVRALLFYMYSGQIEGVRLTDIRDLYEAADKYQVTALRKKFSAILLEHLRYEEADELWCIADMHCDSELKEQVTEFMDYYERAKERN